MSQNGQATQEYRIVRGSHYDADSNEYKTAGDVVSLTADEARRFDPTGLRLEPATQDIRQAESLADNVANIREAGGPDDPTAPATNQAEVGTLSEEEFHDMEYEARAEAVREGRVDDHLSEIVDHDTSETVVEAAEERQAELDGE